MSILMLLLFVCLGSAHADTGIVVWRDWKDPKLKKNDEYRIFVFDEIRRTEHGQSFHKGAERKVFGKNDICNYIIVPPALPKELAEPDQIQAFENKISELKAFAKRFPISASVINPQLEVMNGVVADFDAGQVYSQGEWMARADYEVGKRKAESQMLVQRELVSQKKADARLAIGRKHAYLYGGGILLYLALLCVTFFRGMGFSLFVLIVGPMATAGWMSYQERGFEWINPHLKNIEIAWKSFFPEGG